MENTNDKTAPLTASIDTPEFLDLVGKLLTADYKEAYRDARKALVAHIDKHGDARAEEARREAATAMVEMQARAECAEAERDAYLQQLVAANQRTAAGDAVCGNCDGEGALYVGSKNGGHYDNCEKCEGSGAQPVAEAAAQADDLPPLTMSVYGTRTALELERQRRADIAAREAHAAAPTAQPTPKENAPDLEDRGAGTNANVGTNARIGTSVAQPTPPNDERGRFLTMVFDMRQPQAERARAVLREAGWARSCWSDAMTERDTARAALRQPGAKS